MVRDKYKKNKTKSSLRHYLTLITLLSLLAAVTIPFVDKVKLRTLANKEVKSIEFDLDEVEKSNSDLKKLIDYFGTTEYIEEQARTKINYRKSDEKVAVIYMKDELNSENKNNTNSVFFNNDINEANSKSNIKRWKQYFFNNYY